MQAQTPKLKKVIMETIIHINSKFLNHPQKTGQSMENRIKENFYNVVPGEVCTMKIAVFYENIKDGIQVKGITMCEALA